MATNLNVIRTLTIKAKTEGVAEADAALKKLAGAGDEVVTASVKTEKATLSAEAALKKLERQVDSAARAQQNMAKTLQTLDRAQGQGLISQQRQNELMQLSLRHFNGAGDAAKKHSQALQELASVSQGLSGHLGTLGSVLTSLGPAGLALGAALALITLGFKAAADAALELADQSGKLVDLSDTVGLTTTQLQALEIAGSQVGLSSEQISGGLEKFSSSLAQIRSGAGSAVETLNRLSPGLVEMIQNAKSAPAAFDLITKAMAKMDSAEKSLVSKEVFGKGATGFGRLGDAAAAAGGIDKLAASLNQIDILAGKQLRTFDDLGDAIRENFKLAGRDVTASFAGPVLEALKSVSEILLDLARIVNLVGPPFAEAFAGPALTSLQAFKTELDGLVTLIQNSAQGDKLQIVAEEFIDPRLIQTVVDFIELLKQLILTIGLAAQAVDRFTGLDFAGAAQSASAAMQAVNNFATAASNLKRTLSGELPATGSGIGLPSIDVLGQKADEVAPKLNKVATAAQGAGKAALDMNDILRANVSALGSAATEAEKYQAKLAGLAKQLQEGKISQDTFNRAASQLNPAVITIKDTIGDLGKSMATAFLTGANAAEAFNRTLQAIATTASSKAIDKLITGVTGGGFDLTSIATQGVIALGATIPGKMFGSADEVEKQNNIPIGNIDSASDSLSIVDKLKSAKRERPHDRDQLPKAA